MREVEQCSVHRTTFRMWKEESVELSWAFVLAWNFPDATEAEKPKMAISFTYSLLSKVKEVLAGIYIML
jgi:hypothetical protein